MCYQLGISGFSKFKKTIYLIETEQYEDASIEMLDSLWAKQTPSRARELSEALRAIPSNQEISLFYTKLISKIQGKSMALKDKGVIKRAIVTPDKHFPLHDVKSINVLCKTIEIVKPDIYIDLGDVGEWESVSAWKYKGKRLPPLEFQLPLVDEEIAEVNKGIDQFDKVLDKI